MCVEDPFLQIRSPITSMTYFQMHITINAYYHITIYDITMIKPILKQICFLQVHFAIALLT